MANLFLTSVRFGDAEDVLTDLLQDPSVDRLYRALALARLCSLYERTGRNERLAESKRELQALYAELKANNPNGLRLFNRTLSQDELLQLGIEDP